MDVVRTKSFVYLIAPDCRVRHFHRRLKRMVVGFAVQLEVFHPSRHVWIPAIRFDTAHGFFHRDVVHADGTSEKTPLPIEDYSQALNYAEADLKDHWELHRRRFLEELQHEP